MPRLSDLATSGGQAIEAVKSLQDAGATVDRIVVAIEAAGLRFESLFTTADFGITPGR